MNSPPEFCPQCTSIMGPNSCTSCGWYESIPVARNELELPETFQIGELTLHSVRLHLSTTGFKRYFAQDSSNAPMECMIAVTKNPIDRRLEQIARHPHLYPELILVDEWDEMQIAIFRLKQGRTITEHLAKAIENRAVNDCADLVERFVVPVVETIQQLHRSKLSLACHNPSEIWLTDGGKVAFLDLPLTDASQMSKSPLITRAFSPPEAYGRSGGSLDARADVFFLGMLLFHALARTAVSTRVGLLEERLPPPNLFHPRVHPELCSVTRRATSLIPSFRYEDAGALLKAIKWSLVTEQSRATPRMQQPKVEFATETHIGLMKQKYCDTNQDAFFNEWNTIGSRGLFVVSDGVSISEFGSGDQASQAVCDAAKLRWTELESQVAFGADETLGALDSTMDVSTDIFTSPLPVNIAQRNQILGAMLDAANRNIGKKIENSLPRTMLHPEGIMAATAVCCIIDANRMTYASIGDSRIYLIREGHVSTLNLEHNYTNRLISSGHDFAEAAKVHNGAALVRCVGEFEFDKAHQLIAVPLRPDYGEVYLLPGDIVMLCSDGIPDYIASTEEQAERVILELVNSSPSMNHLAYELVVAANRGGGGDNLTCTTIRIY